MVLKESRVSKQIVEMESDSQVLKLFNVWTLGDTKPTTEDIQYLIKADVIKMLAMFD